MLFVADLVRTSLFQTTNHPPNRTDDFLCGVSTLLLQLDCRPAVVLVEVDFEFVGADEVAELMLAHGFANIGVGLNGLEEVELVAEDAFGTGLVTRAVFYLSEVGDGEFAGFVGDGHQARMIAGSPRVGLARGGWQRCDGGSRLCGRRSRRVAICLARAP